MAMGRTTQMLFKLLLWHSDPLPAQLSPEKHLKIGP